MDQSDVIRASSAGANVMKCRICRCKLSGEEGDDFERGVCGSCVQRPEARHLGTGPAPRGGSAGAPARAFTPAEKGLIERLQKAMPLQQLLAVLNERLLVDLGPDAAPYTIEQLREEAGETLAVGSLGSNDWSATRTFLANARRQGILDRIDESVINAFAVVFQLSPKQVLLLKDVLLGD